MKNKLFTLLALLLVFSFTNAFAQCVIPITDGQPYTEDFDSGTMECWTVEATGAGTWSVMTGTVTNVAATLLREGRAELDLSGVAQGVYTARVSGKDGVAIVKLVKE